MKLLWILFFVVACDTGAEEKSREAAVTNLKEEDDDKEKKKKRVSSSASVETADDSDKHLIRSMAVIGDSFTLGFFSDSTMGKPLSNEGPSERLVREVWIDGKRDFESLASEAAVDFSKLKDNPFSSVGQCDSHACNLGLSKGNVMVYAKPRADIDHMKKQVSKVPEGVDYVVLQVPAAAFCQMNVDSYKDDIKNAADMLEDSLQTLAETDSAPVVLVVPPVDIVTIFENAKSSDTAFDLPRATTCGEARDGQSGGNANVVQLCPAMLDAEFVDEAEKIQKSWFSAIKKSVESIQDEGDLDVFYAEKVSRQKFKSSEMSLDCLHPNAKGLKHITEITWSVIEPYIR